MNDDGAIFITGATGSIGSQLAQRLCASGLHVRALVRDPDRADKLKDLPGLDLLQGDLMRPQGLRGCMDGCSVVYHCAAKLVGADWATSRVVNLGGTQALLTEAVRAGVERFVHLSTIGVYACSTGDCIDEDFPWPRTKSPYFRTKQQAEQAVSAASNAIPTVIMRLGDVTGPGQYAWTVSLIERVHQGTLLPPTNSQSGFLNPVYIDNLLDALLLVRTHPAAVGEAFNIVDGTPLLMSEYIRRIGQMAGKRLPGMPGFVLRVGSAALAAGGRLRGQHPLLDSESVDYVLHKGIVNGQKARTVLGWQPRVGLEQGFCLTEEWLRAEGYLVKV